MRKQTLSISHSKPKSATLPIDHLGGASYAASRTSRLRLTQRRLRFLHVGPCANLRELDISGCATGLHLTVVACPNLKSIHVPDTGDGAVVHIDAGERPPVLEVLGAIRLIDACWRDGEFDAEARKGRAPLRNAVVGITPPSGAWRELVVLHGEYCDQNELTVTTPEVRQLLAIGLAATRIALQSPVDLVRAERCGALVSIGNEGAIKRARVDDCPAFRALNASGTTARLVRSGADEVNISGQWRQLAVLDCGIEALDAPGLKRLVVRDTPNLVRGRLAPGANLALSGDCRLTVPSVGRLELDERAVAGLLARVAHGDRYAIGMLHGWCGQPVRPRETLDALKALATAANPAAAESLWLLRCRLHAANNGNEDRLDDQYCLRYARSVWSWHFPQDLYQEGWNADLRLWHACRHGPSAHACAAVLANGESLPALVALMQLMTHADAADPALRGILLRGLNKVQPPSGPPAGSGQPPQHSLELLVQGSIALRDIELADAVIARISRQLDASAQLSLLGTLSAFGHHGARARLMTLGQHHARERPWIRARALSLAFAPVRAPIFSQEEVIHAS